MSIKFPSPMSADDDGLLAVGGNLEPDTLLAAYSSGIFPWFSEQSPILWWCPDPRMVLFPSEFHASRRLRRRLATACYRHSWDESFSEVIRSCATIPRAGENGTWILPEMIQAYESLHAQGFAHSLEVWEQERLIGGLYGVLHKDVFFAESMFSRQTDGSKMALAHLVDRALAEGWKIIDCQFYTDHLDSLGAHEISREAFLQILASPDVV
jgi:leucyl/phenylalanyl-tRNA--protein transferase